MIKKQDILKERIYYIAFFLMVLTFEFGFLEYVEDFTYIFKLIKRGIYILSLFLFGILYLFRIVEIYKYKKWKDILLLLAVIGGMLIGYYNVQLTYLQLISSIYFYKVANKHSLICVLCFATLTWFIIWVVLFIKGFVYYNSFFPFYFKRFLNRGLYFGFTYKNSAGSLLFIIGLTLSFCLYENNRFLAFGALFLFVLIAILIFYCKTPFYAVIVFTLTYLLLFLIKKYINFNNKILTIIFCILPFIMLSGSIAIGYVMIKFPSFAGSSFSMRFIDIGPLFEKYPINFFGNEISYGIENDYFGLLNFEDYPWAKHYQVWGDNYYFRYLFDYGLIASIGALISSFFINKKVFESKNIFLISFIVSLSTYYMMETVSHYLLFIPIVLLWADESINNNNNTQKI